MKVIFANTSLSIFMSFTQIIGPIFLSGKNIIPPSEVTKLILQVTTNVEFMKFNSKYMFR